MLRRKLLKNLIRKFKWPFLGLILLTFLIGYLSFLIRFNLRTNLYYWQHRGKFYFLFGKFSITEKVEGIKIFVDWNKLLLILFLLYFPVKIIIQFTLYHFQKYYERKAKVYLTKKLLNFAAKNQDLVTQKSSQKVHIINRLVPEFSWQFFTIPINLFNIFIDLSLEIFSLTFLVKTSNLGELVPLVVVLLIVNLIWLGIFSFLTGKTRKLEEEKQRNYQKEEEVKVRIFLENLNSKNNPVSLRKIHTLLDKNSEKISSSFFLSVFTELPSFIIPGFTTLFLFLYYHFWIGGVGGLDWNSYFVAQNLQRILSYSKRMLYWSNRIPDFRGNYRKILSFYN